MILDTLRALETEGLSSDIVGNCGTMGWFASLHDFQVDTLVETDWGTTLIPAGSYILHTDEYGQASVEDNTTDCFPHETVPMSQWMRFCRAADYFDARHPS